MTGQGHQEYGVIGSIKSGQSKQSDIIAQLKKHQEIQHGVPNAVVAHAPKYPNSVWVS